VGEWAYLAAINYLETDFGHDLSESSVGAIRWMQFEPGTWALHAVSADPSDRRAVPKSSGASQLDNVQTALDDYAKRQRLAA